MELNDSLWSFFTHAGPVVKFIMFLLLSASVCSWTLIFQRRAFFRSVEQANKKFDHRFWSGDPLRQLFQASSLRANKLVGVEALFYVGFKEYSRSKDVVAPATVLENVQRQLWVAQAQASEQLSDHLGYLATIGSTSPYVGLLGTVWGIMTSFQALGSVQQATIAMVAPGISEALIATAMGLFAAIPAVVAYNRFSHTVTILENRYEIFHDQFITILSHNIYQVMPQDGQPIAGQASLPLESQVTGQLDVTTA